MTHELNAVGSRSESEDGYFIKKTRFECPICYKTPLSNIFQCKNGHFICDECIPKVGPRCPNCRTQFETRRIRALVIEQILDDVPISCSSKDYGCTQTMKRSEVVAHDKCYHTFTKPWNCTAVNICPNLSIKFSNCKEKVHTSGALIKHLKDVHKFSLDPILVNEKSFSVEYKDIPVNSILCHMDYMKTKLSGKIEQFLVVTNYVLDLKGITANRTMVVLNLGDGLSAKPSDFLANFDLMICQGQEKAETLICSWSGRPLHFKDAEDADMVPHLSTSMKSIKSLINPGNETDFRLIEAMKITRPTVDGPLSVSDEENDNPDEKSDNFDEERDNSDEGSNEVVDLDADTNSCALKADSHDADES